MKDEDIRKQVEEYSATARKTAEEINQLRSALNQREQGLVELQGAIKALNAILPKGEDVTIPDPEEAPVDSGA